MQTIPTETEPTEVQQSLVWRMIFDRPIELETVVDSARRVDQRLQYYQAFAQVIGANKTEREQVLEAMHVLECTHGAPLLVAQVPTIALAISTAIRVLSSSLTNFAQQRNYLHTGIYVAVLIEEAMQILLEQRRTQPTGVAPRSGNPHLDVEDFLAGARTLVALRGASAHEPERNARDVWQIAQIVCLARQHIGGGAGEVILNMAKPGDAFAQGWPRFVSEVNEFLSRCNIAPPPAWRALSIFRRADVQQMEVA